MQADGVAAVLPRLYHSDCAETARKTKIRFAQYAATVAAHVVATMARLSDRPLARKVMHAG